MPCRPELVLISIMLILLTATAASTVAQNAAAEDSAAEAERRWGEAIAAFEQADRTSPPAAGGILFVGSSSIRMWDLEASFPDLPVINRGFGGSQVSDTLHFADRIVLPYRPATVVLYAGDNDIAAGESPEEVARDFQQLVRKIHADLPQTRILFIAVKPSLARWELYDKMHEANQQVEALCDEDDRLTFIDIASPMLDKNGRPRQELFINDGLHLSKSGYQLWTELLKPHVRGQGTEVRNQRSEARSQRSANDE